MIKAHSLPVETTINAVSTRASVKKHSNILVVLGLSVVLDQMLLPMFHPFGISFKFSYLLLIAAPFIIGTTPLTAEGIARQRRFWNLTSPVIWIAVMGLVGQIFLWSQHDIFDKSVLFTQTMTYVLMILAFYFGQRIPTFNMQWIIWILYGAIGTILLLTFWGDRVPFLAKLWWQTDQEVALRLSEVQIRATVFGDGTVVGPGILFLFVAIADRLGFSKVSKFHVVLSTTLMLFIAFIAVSRNQMVAATIIGLGLFLSDSERLGRKLAFLFVVVVALVVVYVNVIGAVQSKYTIINYAVSRFENVDLLDVGGGNGADTILRPLLTWDRFVNRFVASPFLGTGYSTGDMPPFQRLNFHNDWFFVWATSGIVGGIMLFVWMFRIYKQLGLLVLLPFFLPGLTNSFLLHVSGVIVYCFLLGICIERKHKYGTSDPQGYGLGTQFARHRLRFVWR